jgi:hypothetical protein
MKFPRALAPSPTPVWLALCLALLTWAGCKKQSNGLALEHKRIGTIELAVLALEAKKSARLPGVKVEPAPGQQFARLSLHAKGGSDGDRLDESELTLVGSAGTKASPEKDWGDHRLTREFRILEYWFSLPSAEKFASLQLKGQTIPLSGVANVWPFRMAIDRMSVVQKLKISGPGMAEREVAAAESERFVILDVTFEPLLSAARPLPPADEQRGDLRFYSEKAAPDVAVRLGSVLVSGEADLELSVGAVAPTGQDQFFVAKNMAELAVAAGKKKFSCRLALRSHQNQVPKLKQLHFGLLSVNLPALPAPQP